MKFGYIGIDYKHADQDIRDRVSFTDNQKIDFSNAPKGMKTPKMNNLKRISGRKSWIIDQKIIANSC